MVNGIGMSAPLDIRRPWEAEFVKGHYTWTRTLSHTSLAHGPLGNSRRPLEIMEEKFQKHVSRIILTDWDAIEEDS